MQLSYLVNTPLLLGSFFLLFFPGTFEQEIACFCLSKEGWSIALFLLLFPVSIFKIILWYCLSLFRILIKPFTKNHDFLLSWCWMDYLHNFTVVNLIYVRKYQFKIVGVKLQMYWWWMLVRNVYFKICNLVLALKYLSTQFRVILELQLEGFSSNKFTKYNALQV